MLEYGDIVTLEDDKQYVVASTCQYQDVFYVYVVNIEDAVDCILAELRNDELIRVEDTTLFSEVMPLILDNVDESLLSEDDENE